MLVITLALGAGTFFLTQNYLEDKAKEIESAFQPEVSSTTEVIVAIGNINKGDILKPPMVAPVSYPSEYVSEGALTPENIQSYFGKVSNIPLKRAQILYKSNLGGEAVDRFSDLLQDGGTAVTLEVDAKKSNSHMLIPGDFVDILVLADKSKVIPPTLLDLAEGTDPAKKTMLVPLLSKIKVLSVDRNPLVSADEEYRIPIDKEGKIPTYSYVTVGVPINDATKLALAQDLGDIVFFLRNASDDKKVTVRTLESLFSSTSKKIKGSYEYYSSSARKLITPVVKKPSTKDLKNGFDFTSPGLTFDSNTPVDRNKK